MIISFVVRSGSLLSLPVLTLTMLGGCGDTPPPEPATMETFPDGCVVPSTATDLTCPNVCEKFSRCLAGLCAQQTADASVCAPEIHEELMRSCLTSCDQQQLVADIAINECVLASSCADVFVERRCTHDIEFTCSAPIDTDGSYPDSTGESSSSSGWDWSTGYGWDSSSTGWWETTGSVTGSGSSDSDGTGDSTGGSTTSDTDR